MFEKVRYIGIFSYLSILKFNLKIRWQQTNGKENYIASYMELTIQNDWIFVKINIDKIKDRYVLNKHLPFFNVMVVSRRIKYITVHLFRIECIKYLRIFNSVKIWT